MVKPSKGVASFLDYFLMERTFIINELKILDYNYTGGALKRFLRSLKRYDYKKIGSGGFGLKVKTPQYCVIRYKGGIDLLVNTGGYKYLSYICIIKHFPK